MLKVSGDPKRLQYRYQQTKLTLKSGKFDPKNWSQPQVVDRDWFTISDLEPAAMAGPARGAGSS